jgi:hypothetical protein
MRLVFCAGVACSLGIVGVAAGDNMIVNGDFSLTVPSDGFGNGWTGIGNQGGPGVGGWTSTGGNPGERFILNASGASSSDPAISQVIAGLIVGETYRVTGDFYLTHTTSGSFTAKSLGAAIDGVFFFEVARNEVVEGAWNALSFDFVALSETVTLMLVAERNNTDYGYSIDNVTMDVVPGPGAIVLLSAGVLGARRRR